MKINVNDLRKIDLNLAVAFLAIWQERSVTKAAQRLALSQAAVSAALSRLRQTCGDPLFVRTRSGMEPTPRALAMAEPLATQVASLHEVLVAQRPFEPAVSTRRFTLGLSDDLELALGPQLAERLAAQAPGVSTIMRQTHRYNVDQALGQREVELAMVSGPLSQAGLAQENLGELGFACLIDAARMGMSLPITLDDYLRLPHVLVSPLGREGVVDTELRAIGRRRRVQTALTNFSALPAFLTRMDAVATLPAPAAMALARYAHLGICAPPLDLGRFQVLMLWRRDSAGDSGLEWMKEQFRAAFQTISRDEVPTHGGGSLRIAAAMQSSR